jgi:TP901 family phage tail tape measure protein
MERANAGYQASGAGSMVGLGLGMAGAAGVYQALAASRNTSRTITDLMIQGDKDRSWAKNAEKEILRVSDATGKARDEVASYAQMYARLTGNVDIAMKTLGSMGKVAVATGADFGDLAQVTETVVGSLKVKDSDTYQAHDILAQQSKMGKIEYKAIASRIGQLGAEAFRFGKAGEGLPAVQALGGLFQIAARGRSVEQYGEVATGSGRFLERLSQNPEQLQKLLGVKLGVRRGGKFQWNALTDVMQAIGQGTLGKMGDEKTMKKLKTIFDDEGIRPVLQLAMAAKQGWNTKDVASGRESAAAIFGAKGGVLAEDYKKRMDDPAAKWDQAMNRMSNTLHRTMLPVLEKLSSVMPDIAKVVQFLLENSKMLAYFWLGSKGASVIRAMMGGGAGGAGGPGGYAAAAGLAGVAGVAAGVARPGVMPGSDLAVLQQQQALRMARYQQAMGGMLQALPLIPGAIEGGKWLGGKLNRWMGGTYRSEADVQRDRDLGTEQYRMNLERQSERRTRWMRVALARAGMRDWKENTVEGAKTKIERDKLVKELGLKDDDKGGFNLPLGDVMAKHGPKGLEALSSRVQDVYGRIYSKTSEQAVKEGKFEPGSEGFEKRLLEIAPELKVLGPVLKQLEATMAKVVRGEIVVHATVNIPDPSGPGARAKARTGLAATAAGQYSADYGEMEEYGGTPQHVPGML